MEKYKVTLINQSQGTTRVCTYSPDGLDNLGITQELTLDPQLMFGYRPKYSEFSLRFILEDREYLVDLFEKYGTKSKCGILIERNNERVFVGIVDFANAVRYDDSFIELPVIATNFYDVFTKKFANKVTFKYEDLDDVTCKSGAIPKISKVKTFMFEVNKDIYQFADLGYVSSYNSTELAIGSELSFWQGFETMEVTVNGEIQEFPKSTEQFKFGVKISNSENQYIILSPFKLAAKWSEFASDPSTTRGTLRLNLNGMMVGVDSDGAHRLYNTLIKSVDAQYPFAPGMDYNYFEFPELKMLVPNYTGAETYDHVVLFIYFTVRLEFEDGTFKGALTDYNTMEGTAEFTIFESSGALDVDKEVTFKGLKIAKLLDFCFGAGNWIHPDLNQNQYITSSAVILINGDLSLKPRESLTDYLTMNGLYLSFRGDDKIQIGYISEFMGDFEGHKTIAYSNYIMTQFSEALSIGSIWVGQKAVTSEYQRPYDNINQKRTFLQEDSDEVSASPGKIDLSYEYLLIDWYLFLEQFYKIGDVEKNDSDDKVFFIDTDIDMSQVNNLNTYGLDGLTFIIGNTNYTPKRVINKWIDHINRLFAMRGGNRIKLLDNEGNQFNFVCNGIDEFSDIVVPSNIKFYKIIEIEAVIEQGIDFSKQLVEFEHRGTNYIGMALSAITTDDLTVQKIQVLI